MFKKSMLAAVTAAALIGLAVPAAAETFTSSDGVLSMELPNDSWKEMADPLRWIVLSDGANMITADHYSNGEDLPDMTVADSHYVNVYQAIVSTQNEVFVITGSLVDASKIGEVCETILSAKVLKYDTKMAVKKEAAAPAAGGFTIAAKDATMYATAGINVRASYSTSSDIIGALAEGESMKVTGVVQSDGKDIGWYQISHNGNTGYVSASFVSDKAPEAGEKKDSTEKKDVQFTANAKTIYDSKGNAITVYLATDGKWYDKPGTAYVATTDYEFTANGQTFYVNKPQVNNTITPTGDSFEVYWLNGNATRLTPYSDGYWYSSEWVRYSLSDGVYYGADGTQLYTNADGSYRAEKHSLTGNSVTVYWGDGTPETLYEYSDGNWYTEGGLAFANGGDGNYYRTDGQTLYGYVGNNRSGSGNGEGDNPYPTGNTVDLFWSDGTRTTLYEYEDGYWYTPNGIAFTRGDDGNYYNSEGLNLYWYNPTGGTDGNSEGEVNSSDTSGDSDDYVEQHYLSQEQSGKEVLVTAGGGAYYDEEGTEYSWIDGGQMMDYYGNRYNVIW